MVAAQTIPVLESKLAGLEKDHEFREQIEAKGVEVDALEAEYDAKNEEMKLAKKAMEKAIDELRQMIKAGPPKADPQKRLPFAEDAEGSEQAEGESTAAPAAKLDIPADIDALDISDLQKERLVKAGCKSMADVIDLGNKNWPDFPRGFDSLDGFGPRAAGKLKKLLPSTAPAKAPSDEAKQIRVKLITFSGASPNLEPGSEYDATELGNGNAIIQLPGSEPVEFLPHEFEKIAHTEA